ncbi:MAG: hypothetical protein AB1439_06390 [candidate division FCPU426 bacterium]
MHKGILGALLTIGMALFLPAPAAWASTTPVNVTSVVVSPATIGNPAQYAIDIDIAADGELTGGVHIISVVFPYDTLVSSGSISGITVEGTAAASAIGNAASYQIDITPTQTLAGGTTAVTLLIPAAAIRNPTTTGLYSLMVLTSIQPAGTSPNYSIGVSSTSVNISSVTPSPNYVNTQAQYTIGFNTSADGALLGGVSQIVITFPSDSVVLNGTISGLTVNGTVAASASGNSSLRRITIIPTQTLAGSTSVTLIIPSAGVRNPTIPSTYTLTISTTVQPAGTSPAYDIYPLPTATFTPTRTVTPTSTATPTRTSTRTATPTRTHSPTFTQTPTFTISPTSTVTPTITLTSTPSPTVIATATTTPTPFELASGVVTAYPVPAIGNDLWFAYATAGPAEVTIEIHAVTGERVHSLSDQASGAGTRRVHWDIEKVAPGVYFYRLVIRYPDQSTASKFDKFVIIKR